MPAQSVPVAPVRPGLFSQSANGAGPGAIGAATRAPRFSAEVTDKSEKRGRAADSNSFSACVLLARPVEERLKNLSAFSHSFLMEGALGTGPPTLGRISHHLARRGATRRRVGNRSPALEI